MDMRALDRLAARLKAAEQDHSADENGDGEISPKELHRHFDDDGDGKVDMQDYAKHINIHMAHPEWLAKETAELVSRQAGVPKEAAEKARLKNPEGGLTAAGRRHYAKTEGANLKPGVKNVDEAGDSEKKRWARWAVRFYSNPRGPMTNDKGEPTRLALMANAWGTKVPKTREEAQSIAARGRKILESAKGSVKEASEPLRRILYKEADLRDAADAAREQLPPPVASRTGRPRGHGFEPRNEAEKKQRDTQRYHRKEPPARPGLEVFRDNVTRHYGKRAPHLTGRLLDLADSIENMDPAAARQLSGLSTFHNEGSYHTPSYGGSINLSTLRPATALHEFGHHRDRLTQPDSFFGNRGFFGFGGDIKSQLPSEASATRQAFSALGGVNPAFAATNGTYWEGALRESGTPRNLSDAARLAVRDRTRRLDEHEGKLRQAHKRIVPSTDNQAAWSAYTRAPNPQQTLLNRLEQSHEARRKRKQKMEYDLENPVLSPRMQRLSLGTRVPDEVVKAMNADIGPGVGEAAYGWEETLRSDNLRREHPRARAAREFFEIPDPYQSGKDTALSQLGTSRRMIRRSTPTNPDAQAAPVHGSVTLRGTRLGPKRIVPTGAGAEDFYTRSLGSRDGVLSGVRALAKRIRRH